MKVKCRQCGKILKEKQNKFCSNYCRAEFYWYNKKITKNTKRN